MNHGPFKRIIFRFILTTGPVLPLLVLFTPMFGATDLDVSFARFFYSSNPENHWPAQDLPLWQFFYYAAPWLTGLLLCGSLTCIYIGLRQKNQLQFRQGLFVFLVGALGPGLIVNAVLKPYAGRARPRQIEAFAGPEKFQNFYEPRFGGPGKSLPCGHCSVGFAYSSLAFVTTSPAIQISIASGSVLLGLAMGLGRMADGAHFASDIWLSFIAVNLVQWLLFIGIFRGSWIASWNTQNRVSLWLQQKFRVLPQIRYTIALILLGAILVSLLVASPFHQSVNLSFDTINTLSIESSKSISLKIEKTRSGPALQVHGEFRGFGWPKSRLDLPALDPNGNLHLMFDRLGFFTDLEGELSLTVNPEKITNSPY